MKKIVKFYIYIFLGADNLCGRLMEKINSSNNVKQALAHMPLILVCMEVLINILKQNKFKLFEKHFITFIDYRA